MNNTIKTLQEFSSEELFNELKNRKEDLEILDIKTKTFQGVCAKDLIFYYTIDSSWPPHSFFLCAPHLKKSNKNEFLYNVSNGYYILEEFVPSFLSESEEGIYECNKLEKECIDILNKCGIECQRNDEWFDY